MPDPSRLDTPPPHLAKAVDDNLIALYYAFCTLPDSEMVVDERLCYHHAFPSNPLFKAVWRTHLAEGEVEDAIDRVIAWFKSRGAPFFYWWVNPHTRPADMPERLLARGFEPGLVDSRCMGIDLRSLSTASPQIPGFVVKLVETQPALEDWRDVLVSAYESPSIIGQAWVDATLALGLANAPWKLYLGYLDGQPVATILLFDGAGVTGLLAVSTLACVRGRGIGTGITLLPLLQARQQGARTCVLFSSDMGYGVYRRMGFWDLEYKISRYIWFNS